MREESLARQFRGFGAAAERDGGITYGAISRAVAEDDGLLDITASAPLAQRRPNLLFAAVHFLLLGGVAHPLGDFYDTVRTDGVAPDVHEVGPVFRDFCLAHQSELLELIATRSTQTNEVGRCAILLPALSTIAASYGGDTPISLLDLGTSAGLNLLFDRYRYTYRQRHTGHALAAGDPASTVDLTCSVADELEGLPTLTMPMLADRAGLDLCPIDATSDDDARWLLACLWPDNLTRFNRLRHALELWRDAADRPRLHQGDMVDDLASVANQVGGTTPLVIFHSWAVAYLTAERQRDLVDAIAALGQRRAVHHLYAELPDETPGLPTPESPEPTKALGATALVHIGPHGAVPERLAEVHPHGAWIRWWGSRPA